QTRRCRSAAFQSQSRRPPGTVASLWVLSACARATQLGLAAAPAGGAAQSYGISILTGIGFMTTSLFICLLAFHDEAKAPLNPAAVLVASLLPGAGGTLCVVRGGRQTADKDVSRYDPMRQRFIKSRRSKPVTFCATACLRQVRRASSIQTAI